ncbi:MAG TPA: hypothetical protein PLQ56_13595 [Aggregatilineales bacterium]|nr:hypothetical protein [Aggregatilineales bacterium]
MARFRGEEFQPVGGIHDGGIDGIEPLFHLPRKETIIYQFSIRKDAKDKIVESIERLHRNGIKLQRFYYVTNQRLRDRVPLEEELSEKYSISVQIWGLDWFESNVNHSSSTISEFDSFRKEYLHEYEKPGKAYEVSDLETDPRVFVFLRQQWDASRDKNNLDEVLADTLILFALEGTDPDKNILRTRSEIVAAISDLVKIDMKWLQNTIDNRLRSLSSKPRRIKHHKKENAYCLPYETRLEIQERNLADLALYKIFYTETETLLRETVNERDASLNVPYNLFEEIFHRLFRQQGLEFSNFLETGDGSISVEKSLRAIIEDVVESNGITSNKRHAIQDILQQVVRNTLYRGSIEQLTFLRKLADTYKLLFLLQCDPQIATYFSTMVSSLRIYVDTSIIIPAMSEYFLEQRHRRHWNLLTSARNAGVSLIVNDVIVRELASHFRHIMHVFREKYSGNEEDFTDDIAVLYVDNILIRSYFYAKLHGQVFSFEEFIETFISVDMQNIADELISWLEEAFGIWYEARAKLKLTIDPEEEAELYQELRKYKPSDEQARNDARQLLTIYALRELNEEHSANGIYGYRTWWLTTDTVSQKSFDNLKGNKLELRKSPYIRADFLYNHVTLAPSKKQVDNTFERVFPSIIGVNISYHIPDEIRHSIQKYIKEHAKLIGKPRLKAILRDLTHRLKSDPNSWTKESVELFLDQRRKEITSSVLKTKA